MTFELPDINYIKKYKNEYHKDASMGDIAHGLSGMVFAIAFSCFIFYEFYTKTHIHLK
ncbi:MAG: hypothetical protein WC428_00120 [Candidatus Paceibacterota bacterium]|jgi:hypothetical protein